MNDKLAEAEKKMFIELYGEDEAARVEALPPIKRMKVTSDGPPKDNIRFQIDKEKNINKKK